MCIIFPSDSDAKAIQTKTNSVAFSPPVNYTDSSLSAQLVPTIADARVSSGHRDVWP
jgi:hypothetical protein